MPLMNPRNNDDEGVYTEENLYSKPGTPIVKKKTLSERFTRKEGTFIVSKKKGENIHHDNPAFGLTEFNKAPSKTQLKHPYGPSPIFNSMLGNPFGFQQPRKRR